MHQLQHIINYIFEDVKKNDCVILNNNIDTGADPINIENASFHIIRRPYII